MINMTTLYTRLGSLGAILAATNTFQNLLNTDTNTLTAEFTGNDLTMIDGIEAQLNSGQTSAGSYLSFIQQVGQNIINTMVLDDNPLLTDTNLQASLQEVIRQMYVGSQTLKQNLSSVTITPSGNNLGNGVVVCSVLTPDGRNCELAIAENVTVQCTSDQTTSFNLAGNEGFTINGQVAYDSFNWLYPGGSGSSTSCNAIDASVDDTNGTFLNNGDFEDTWTANVPASWSVLVGTPATTILQGGTAYTGTSSLEFVGNGSQLTSVAQEFDSTDGTTEVLSYGNLYAVNCWVYVPTNPTAGVLTVSLVDGSGTVIDNEQGTANTISINLHTMTAATWVPLSGVFILPQIQPTEIQLAISLSTALTSAAHVFVDRIAFGNMSTLYLGGPSFAVFSGSSDFFAGYSNNQPGDFFTAAIANARSSNNTFTWLMDRLFDLKSLQLLPPTSASNTISDGLI